jgi:hypothetical protein
MNYNNKKLPEIFAFGLRSGKPSEKYRPELTKPDSNGNTFCSILTNNILLIYNYGKGPQPNNTTEVDTKRLKWMAGLQVNRCRMLIY